MKLIERIKGIFRRRKNNKITSSQVSKEESSSAPLQRSNTISIKASVRRKVLTNTTTKANFTLPLRPKLRRRPIKIPTSRKVGLKPRTHFEKKNFPNTTGPIEPEED